MGPHSGNLFEQTLAYGFALLLPILVIALLIGAAWETHKRRHGRAAKPGSSHEAVSARFAPAAE